MCDRTCNPQVLARLLRPGGTWVRGWGRGAAADARSREAGAGRGEALPSLARGDTDAGGSGAAEAVSLPVDRARLQWSGQRAGTGRAAAREHLPAWLPARVAGRRGRGGSCAEAPGAGDPWGREPRSLRRGGGQAPLQPPTSPPARSRQGPGGKASPQRAGAAAAATSRRGRAAGGRRQEALVGQGRPGWGATWGGGDDSFGGSRVLGVEDEAGCKRDSGLRGSRVRVFFQDTPLYF